MKLVLAIFASVILSSVNADVSKEQQQEVEYLMRFVKHSACEINRNGRFYTGDKAVSHIQKKYDYFRDEINTTEEFIEYAATKSTMTGKYYLVRCGNGEAIRTKEWLLNELNSYRQKSAHSKAVQSGHTTQ
jgi:hypothetical protein